MIVVCSCGQKNRVPLAKHFNAPASIVSNCGACHASLETETIRQADRNAGIVLDVAALLSDREPRWTEEEHAIAERFYHHENTA